MSVIPFPDPKQKGSWISGSAICQSCRHEWVAVRETGTIYLECPSCGCNKGVGKHPVGAAEGDASFVCNCGCDALTAYKRAGKFYLRCINCGVDHTMAVWEA